MNKIGWKWLPVGLFLLLCLFFWRGLSLDPHYLPSVQVGKKLPAFSLPLLNNPAETFQSRTLPHKPVLLNIFASWCEACVEEQLFLMQLAKQGIPIYGLNYKDRAQDAQQWLAQWGNPYLIVAEDRQGRASIDLGVYGAPETFLIDKNGIIRYRHVGILKQKDWDEVLGPMLHKLEQNV